MVWSATDDPFIGRHGVISPDGVTRVRQILWQRVDADMAGRSDLRTLVGIEVPAFLDLHGLSGAEFSGDGQAGVAPLRA